MISPYIVHSIFRSNIIYERNILISINRTDEPFGVKVHLKKDLGPGLESFEVRAGYREILDIEGLIKEQGIPEKVIFYGVEDIVTRNPIWHIFSLIKRINSQFCSIQQAAAQPPAGNCDAGGNVTPFVNQAISRYSYFPPLSTV